MGKGLAHSIGKGTNSSTRGRGGVTKVIIVASLLLLLHCIFINQHCLDLKCKNSPEIWYDK